MLGELDVLNLKEMCSLLPHLKLEHRYITLKYALNLLLDASPLGDYSRVSYYYDEKRINYKYTPDCAFLEKEGIRLLFECLPSIPYDYMQSLLNYKNIDKTNLKILFDACEHENERLACRCALKAYHNFERLKRRSLISCEELIRKELQELSAKEELLNSFNDYKYSYLPNLLKKHHINYIGDNIISEIKKKDNNDDCAEIRHFVDVYNTEVINGVLWKYGLI